MIRFRGLGLLSPPATIGGLLASAAARWGVSLELLTAVARRESAFNPAARSPVGAAGVMQLMPATAAQYGVSNPWDAAQNIDGGAHLLADLLRKYNGNVTLALAAYNAGPGNVAKYGGVPPFPETQNYVARIESDLGGSSSAPFTPYGPPLPADYGAEVAERPAGYMWAEEFSPAGVLSALVPEWDEFSSSAGEGLSDSAKFAIGAALVAVLVAAAVA